MTIFLLRQISEHRINAIKTGAFMLSFMGLGMFESMLGPSLLDLRLAVDGTLDDIVWVLPASMVGYITGATLSMFYVFYYGIPLTSPHSNDRSGGFVFYRHLNPFLSDTISLLSSAVFLGFIGYNRTLLGMLFTFTANGIALGIVDASKKKIISISITLQNASFVQWDTPPS